MQVQYDTEADALYVQLASGEVARTRRLDSSRAVDYRADGTVVGGGVSVCEQGGPVGRGAGGGGN